MKQPGDHAFSNPSPLRYVPPSSRVIDEFPGIDGSNVADLWQRMERTCGTRLGRLYRVLPLDGGERPAFEHPDFTVWSFAGDLRFGTRDGWGGEAGAGGGDERCIAVACETDRAEEIAAARAILESRIVALAMTEERSEGASRAGLPRLPFPSPEPVFVDQLAALFEHGGASRQGAWAIERVVADLYELDLEALVDIQTQIRPGG